MERMIYKKESTSEISFPLGGIGTGSIGLAGNGRLIDWEIFNRPNKGSDNGHSHIAVKATKNGRLIDARVLNGDVYHEMSGKYGKGFGYGLNNSSMAGFPHFSDWTFCGEFPFAKLNFGGDFPGNISLTAFNPFIVRNENDSGIPGAFFEISITNTTEDDIDYSVAFSLRNPYVKSKNDYIKLNEGCAIFMTQSEADENSAGYGDISLATDGGCDGNGKPGITSYQQYWFRGGWWDHVETYWRNFVEHDTFANRIYENPGHYDIGTICVKMNACAGKTVKVKYIITWNIPNMYNYWDRYIIKDENGAEKDYIWKNYYSTLFANSLASAKYSINNWDRLYNDTKKYHDELFLSSLPQEVIEAVSATVSVLKTPTVLRVENGNFWGWEGCGENHGSCDGSCTHVWNYAYAMAFLFPSLERNIRDTDYLYNYSDDGKMTFRQKLPMDREKWTFRACVDGQMGGIIKIYREWKISGDNEWLKNKWEHVKKSLEYAWSDLNPDKWDANKDGVLEGRQHHTLDMELFGPSSWLESFYLAALAAASEMAEFLGEKEKALEYNKLFESGKNYSDKYLWNGEYFIQNINIHDKSILESFGDEAVNAYWNNESKQIKYQIGQGSEIDQMCGQWHAAICGIKDIFNPDLRKKALESMYKNNFKSNMRNHYNTFRIFAQNDESGAVMCDFPGNIEKPAIPIPYAQECMHGFEYQFAGLLISEGLIEKGLSVVRSVRDRYAGYNRNPWNEIECGSNYARSMASYALIPILSGFYFDMPNNAIGFEPKINKEDFRCIWSLNDAWGNIIINKNGAELNILDGKINIKKFKLPEYILKNNLEIICDSKKIDYSVDKNFIIFNNLEMIENNLKIKII